MKGWKENPAEEDRISKPPFLHHFIPPRQPSVNKFFILILTNKTEPIHHNGIVRVRGSRPLGSTILRIGGFLHKSENLSIK